ncbi:MAG: hypothetical protein U0746_16390 [Gemmataceae bacterium]
MKQGPFLHVPEGPADVERLWRQSALLDTSRLPSWLTPDDTDVYRLAAAVPIAALGDDERPAYLAARAELEDQGLVIETNGGVERFYLARPQRGDTWAIGIYRGPSPLELTPVSDNPVLTRDDVSDVAASNIADPFAIWLDGTWHLFFEVWNWRSNKGEVGHATSPDGVRWAYDRIVLAEPFHLSYPQVFVHAGDVYMIPETFQAGAVRLYKARPFPNRWAFVAALIEGPYLVDASVFRHDSRWWMFVDASSDQGHDTLRLYGANELTGPWREHPASPVVAGDPHNARPGGRVVAVGGRPIRFAQNCSPDYGMDVRAFLIDELTSTAHRERPVGRVVGPSGHGWNAAGMHHIDAHAVNGEWLAFVDGWQRPAAGDGP